MPPAPEKSEIAVRLTSVRMLDLCDFRILTPAAQDFTVSGSNYDPRYQQIVQLLIKARLSAGLTQEEIARAIDLTQPDVSKIETCQRRVDVLELFDWMRATNSDALLTELLNPAP